MKENNRPKRNRRPWLAAFTKCVKVIDFTGNDAEKYRVFALKRRQDHGTILERIKQFIRGTK
jgi:hypothetical protein